MATIRTEGSNARRGLAIVVGLACLGLLFFQLRVIGVYTILELVGGASESSLKRTVPFQLPPKNRTVLLVHVGKAGGLTLKEQLKEWKHSLDNATTVFPKSVHMWSQLQLLEKATTYLVTVRNPVDRIISTYRYSHVKNCSPKIQQLGGKGHRVPFGCSVQHQSKNNKKMRLWAEKVFGLCFPSAAMEDFAQSTMSPWPTLKNGSEEAMPLFQQRDCQLLARQMVEGSLVKLLVAPHMEYNYEYYASKSIRQHPRKEVWVIGSCSHIYQSASKGGVSWK